MQEIGVPAGFVGRLPRSREFRSLEAFTAAVTQASPPPPTPSRKTARSHPDAQPDWRH